MRRPPFVPSAIVFDLDGVLVDSEPLWERAERRVVETYGRPWDPAVRQLMLGRSPAQSAAVLVTYLGLPASPAEVRERVSAETVAEFRAGMEPLPGVRALLRNLSGLLPLAVATNSERHVAELSLSGAGLTGSFDAVVTAEDVAAAKPAPDPYTTACARVAADPARSVAIEDSPVGVASAKAAGLWVLGCPSVAGTPMTGADAIVDSLTRLRLADLSLADHHGVAPTSSGPARDRTDRGRPAS